MEQGDDAQLRTEAEVFGRYLVGDPPSPAVIDRYLQASRTLFSEPVSPRDTAVVAFARRHPWSVAFLDGAAGLLNPNGLLRGKILVMAALLETAPECADEFLPQTVRPVGLLGRLVLSGIRATVSAGVGVALHAYASRVRP